MAVISGVTPSHAIFAQNAKVAMMQMTRVAVTSVSPRLPSGVLSDTPASCVMLQRHGSPGVQLLSIKLSHTATVAGEIKLLFWCSGVKTCT